MSEVRLVIREEDRDWSGTIHGSVADRAVASLSAGPAPQWRNSKSPPSDSQGETRIMVSSRISPLDGPRSRTMQAWLSLT